MNILLQRFERKSDRVLGVMSIGHTPLYNTLEPANCIPTGTYEVKLTWSPHFKQWLPELMNVPGRTAIRIHAGNHPRDTKGCILIGQRFRDYIIYSRAAMADLINRFNNHEKEIHTITVE